MRKIVYMLGNYMFKALGKLRGRCRRLRDVFRVSRYDLVSIHM